MIVLSSEPKEVIIDELAKTEGPVASLRGGTFLGLGDLGGTPRREQRQTQG